MSGGEEASDPDLVARALRGQDHAFTLLMRRHKAGVYRFARRYVGQVDAALEVTQETFVAAWRALARYDGTRPFDVWLRAIAINKCRDRARRLAVRRVVFGEKHADSPEAQRQADPAPRADTTMADAEQRAALDAAIARLPANLKAALLLTHFEERSQREVADILGVSIKTVETRVYRARQRLTDMLARSDFREGSPRAGRTP